VENNKEFVIEVTDSMVIRAGRNKNAPLTFQIEEDDPANPDIDAVWVALWVQDIDRLIAAMLDLKRAIRNEYE